MTADKTLAAVRVEISLFNQHRTTSFAALGRIESILLESPAASLLADIQPAAAPSGASDPVLSEAAKWLHAAYDRPPLTPEAAAMLARVDAALAHPSEAPSKPKTQREWDLLTAPEREALSWPEAPKVEARAGLTSDQLHLIEAYRFGQFSDDMLDHPSASCRSPAKVTRQALRRVLQSWEDQLTK